MIELAIGYDDPKAPANKVKALIASCIPMLQRCTAYRLYAPQSLFKHSSHKRRRVKRQGCRLAPAEWDLRSLCDACS